MSQSHPDLQELLYHPNDTDKYLRNLGKVSLYFSQFNREVITEKVAYTVSTVLYFYYLIGLKPHSVWHFNVAPVEGPYNVATNIRASST